MRDPASNDPQNTEPVDIQMADMGRELGCRESPAFERLRDYLRVQSELPSRVIAEIVEMLNARCFADTQSWRQSRGAALWTELHWLNEEMLIEAFAELWMPQYYQWKSSALVRHANAGPALWMQVLSRPVHVRTILEINTQANARGDRVFLEQLENALATLDIVSSIA